MDDTIVFLIRVENKTPKLPIVIIVIKYKLNVDTIKLGETPPNRNTILYSGMEDTIINNKYEMDDISLLKIILVEDCGVVSKIFNVCLSRSPLMTPEVNPGVINKINANCTKDNTMNMARLCSGLNIAEELNIVFTTMNPIAINPRANK
jgi:hypothetical protein